MYGKTHGPWSPSAVLDLKWKIIKWSKRNNLCMYHFQLLVNLFSWGLWTQQMSICLAGIGWLVFLPPGSNHQTESEPQKKGLAKDCRIAESRNLLLLLVEVLLLQKRRRWNLLRKTSCSRRPILTPDLLMVHKSQSQPPGIFLKPWK